MPEVHPSRGEPTETERGPHALALFIGGAEVKERLVDCGKEFLKHILISGR
jgi:hypothetical protein